MTALNLIPQTDWRAWAIAIVFEAAVNHKDLKVASVLIEPLEKEIKAAEGDNKILADLIYQSALAKYKKILASHIVDSQILYRSRL